MQRADHLDDTDGWYQVTMGTLSDVNDETMSEPIRWCKLHVSDGRFDYGIKWGLALFRFEQLEDAMMFRLVWSKS